MRITLINTRLTNFKRHQEIRHFYRDDIWFFFGCQKTSLTASKYNQSSSCNSRNKEEYGEITAEMEDIAGVLELVSIQEEIRNSFKEDNKNIIFYGGLASESTSYALPKYEGKSINIEVNTFMNTTKEIVSQIEPAKDSIQSIGNENIDEDRCMIAIRSGEIITAGRAEKACKMVFQHSTVSLVHFMVWGIQFDADSVPLVYLRDISLNGMLINGQTIGRNQTALLYDGDIIEVRCVAVFRFREFECAQWLQTPKRQSTIKDWTISYRMLGSGSFGSVYVAKYKDEKKNFAVKVIKGLSNSNNPSLRQERFKNEAEILLKINHVCVP